MENNYTIITLKDLDLIESLYLNYFNKEEHASWTKETVKRKFKQFFNREDLIAYKINDGKNMIGFFIGQLVQFDDGLVFELLELLVFKAYQNKGYGSLLLEKAIKEAKETGAFLVQLTSSVDEVHHNFYNIKNGFSDAKNNVWKTKII